MNIEKILAIIDRHMVAVGLFMCFLLLVLFVFLIFGPVQLHRLFR